MTSLAIRTLAALVFAAGAAAAVKIPDGYKVKLPEGWAKSEKLTAASQELLSPNADGGAVAWEKKANGAIARVVWLRGKVASGVTVREEVEGLHEVFKLNADGARVVSWDVTETKVLMTSQLKYLEGDAIDGKGKTVRQVAIAGVDRDGMVRGWSLECGFPTASAAKAEKDCEALAKSLEVTLPASDFRAIEPKKK